MRRITAQMALIVCASAGLPAQADSVQVAVASNFSKVASALVEPFKVATGHDLKLSFGSSGKFVAQITHGAPFDVFLSADIDKPHRLVEDGLAIGSPKVYAIGQLVLWSPTLPITGPEILTDANFRHLAIANARLAPYGAAAEAVLEHRQLSDSLKGRRVEGENISQTYQFVASGAAQLGFIALSQVSNQGQLTSGTGWVVPASEHPPIEQAAVILKHGAKNPAAIAFFDYLFSDTSQAIMQRFGYQRSEP